VAEASEAELGWLAGLINGEGCFLITRANKGYACAFHMQLRADDVHVLERARRISGGLGRIVCYDKAFRNSLNPMAKWHVCSRDDCRELANLLLTDGMAPLAGAKAFQFLTWYEALLEWSTVVPANNDRDSHDWSKMAELYDRLKSLRAYGSTPSLAVEPKADKGAIA